MSKLRGLASTAFKSLKGLAPKLAGTASKSVPVLGTAYGVFGGAGSAGGDLQPGERFMGTSDANQHGGPIGPSNKPNTFPDTNPYSLSSGGSGYALSSPTSGSKSGSKSVEEKQINKMRKAQQEAYEKEYKKAVESATGRKDRGEQQINSLLDLLSGSFDTARERLDRGRQQGYDEFEGEKQSDINKLRSFFATIGIGDSEQSGQARERMMGDYAKRMEGMETSYGDSLKDLEQQRMEREADYSNKRMDLQGMYEDDLAGAKQGKYRSQAEGESSINALLKDLRDYNLKERALDLNEIRTNYAVNKPYSSGAAKPNFNQVGYSIGADGKPVYQSFDPITGQKTPIDQNTYNQLKYGYVDPFQSQQGVPGGDEFSGEVMNELQYLLGTNR